MAESLGRIVKRIVQRGAGESGGEGIGRYQGLLSSPGITNIHSTGSSARYLYLKSTTDFRLHFNYNGIRIGIGISSSLSGYSHSDWANDSTDC